MARRKTVYDPRQLTLFDIFADHITNIRTQNAADDAVPVPATHQTQNTALQKAAPDERPAASVPSHSPISDATPASAPESRRTESALVQTEDDIENMRRVGTNSKGEGVYEFPNGTRMHSFDPGLMQVMDGDWDTPEQLYAKKKYDFLTTQEVINFNFGVNPKTTPTEAHHAGSSNATSGNRREGTAPRNNTTREEGRELPPLGVSDSGSLGAQRAGDAEGAGDEAGRGHPAAPSVRADGDGEGRLEHGVGSEDASAGDDGIGDTGPVRSRYPRENYRITLGDDLGVGGAAVKYEDNIKAIRLLKRLDGENAQEASPEEKRILVRYVGWGGLPQAFDGQNTEWRQRGEELRRLLPPDEYAKARRSTQDAHYTSETVIRGIYDGLERLGMKDTSLNALEPSAGIGNFIGLCPPSLDARFTAVEQDAISAQIIHYLYPEANLIPDGYQRTAIRPGTFDLAVGNPPFGSQHLFDQKHPELNKFSIHNYFLTKSIDKLRDGGIAAFVVSRYFMDAVDTSVREHIANQAEFLGAIRLPKTAFRENALTEVTTDIVFFQKTTNPQNRDWVHTQPMSVYDPDEVSFVDVNVNSYFVDHPEQMIGQLVRSGGSYRETVNCETPPETDLNKEISSRLAALPQDIYTPKETEDEIQVAEEASLNTGFIDSAYFRALKDGAFCNEPHTGRIVCKTTGEYGNAIYAPVPLKRDSERPRLAALIDVRDALRDLLNAEKAPDADTAELMRLRYQLNTKYDYFVKKFGLLNSSTNRSIFRDDPESSLVQSLELEYDKGISPELARRTGGEARRPSAKKAAIFKQRVLAPAVPVSRVDNPQDALIICLRENGKINFDRIGELANISPDEAQKELRRSNLVFLNPGSNEWEIRERYLSGNVRHKLHEAEKAAAKDPQFNANVVALKDAMPPDIEAVDIGVQFGSTWLPGEVIEKFLEEVLNADTAQVRYISALGKWNAKVNIFDGTVNRSVWGIPEYPAERLVESLLRGTPIKVEKDSGMRDDNGKPVMVVDQELTAAAMQKADEIKQAFKDWIWTDDERREQLTKLYNERFNTHVPPNYNGQHIELVNANPDVKLRPHQKNVIWRSIQEGTGLFDHVVGAGKTLACVASIMEGRRMGFMKKPMIVVPNHLVYQWRDEFYKLYPDANILVAEKSDFIKQNRERFFSRIATSEWDAVIVPHSSFKKIDMPYETQQEILQEQIDAVVAAIAESKEAQGGRATIKQLEKQKERMEERYQALIAKGGEKDKSVDFSDLGVDALFVDESQEFKNLGFATSMNVAGLGNITGSSKALDLYIKCRYLQKKQDGRGVFFLTGTPISNSIAEVFTLQRYLQYDTLAQMDLLHFDAWASTFGQITNGWELDATGVNYKLKSRFASFQNVPELLSMYRSFADVVTKADLDKQAREANLKPYTPPIEGGAPQNIVMERSDAQGEFMDKIIERMENLPRDARLDNPLKITNDARKAGLDFRLIEPEAGDFAGSKVNAAVERIYDIWKDTAGVKGTQLVFCDLSTPKGGGKPADVVTLENASQGNTTDMVEVVDDDDEVQTAPDMDDMLAMSGGSFSVYDDMRRKLIGHGIPADEIAFIHEANTDLRKSKLFADMQSGRVRILFGSTSKMGAGTNVQKRLVAAHHLDAPWRPSDLEQRNGRIIRQGNDLFEADPDNFKVEIDYYATKRTYDARMWQTIEYKAAAIEQFRKGDLLQRVIDDVQSEAATAAEMKAAASGNPLILYQVQIASDLRKLEALSSQHQRTQHRLRDRLKYLQGASKRYEEAKTIHDANVRLRDTSTRHVMEKGEKRIQLVLEVDGRQLDGEINKKDIQQRFLKQIQSIKDMNLGEELPVGKYRGFGITVTQRSSTTPQFQFSLKGAVGSAMYPENLRYVYGDKFSLSGFFQRVDNILDKGLQQRIESAKQHLDEENREIITVEANLAKPFAQQQALELARENHSAVLAELKRMQDDKGYESTWTPNTLEAAQPTPKPDMPPTGCGMTDRSPSLRM